MTKDATIYEEDLLLETFLDQEDEEEDMITVIE